MFTTVLVANRGEIACRVIKTLRRLGIRSVAVYSEADRDALHVALADTAAAIGPAPAAESYLNTKRILKAAAETGAEAIHPGYGFLSENAEFAEAAGQAGLTFIGPPPAAIRAMGRKDEAKRLMDQAGVPVVPGYHGEGQDPEHLAAKAADIGFPVLIKAVAGGGGKGMRRVDKADGFAGALQGAMREAKAAFGDDRVLIEKFVLKPRHIEIQVFADRHGGVVHLFERDCSLQRRHQKVIEEAPAPGLPDSMRTAMGKAACEAARAIGYEGAGTVEFIAGSEGGLSADKFWFMEMNTRLQVEHPVTEMITAEDLVEWQVRVAAGEPLPVRQEELAIHGHAVEARLYAENPQKNFLPATGTLHHLHFPPEGPHLRIDTGVVEGDAVSIHYDPMIAKVIAWDENRDRAVARLERALRETQIAGVTTNLAFLANVLGHGAFRAADIDTGFIDRHLSGLAPQEEAPPAEIRFLAALYLLAERQQSAVHAAMSSGDPYSPWHAVDDFRVNGTGRATFRFSGAHAFELTATPEGGGQWRLETQDAGATGSAVLDDERHLSAVIGGRRVEAGVLRLGDVLHIMHDGRAHRLVMHDPLAAAEMEDGGAATVAAPMPGKIVTVLTKEGATVKRGQALLVLEAMKMEHTLSAPQDGKVERISANEGDQVEEGAVLVTFAGE
ncbi:MAG: acetyl/propionyl/methylcrotonyl-CoA carboxylase subunit alpha, partial [Alphaproteobacteria bacterium]